jgi:Uma2 family endonuclease
MRARPVKEGKPMIVSTGQEIGVRPRRWTKEEYYRLGELGFFRGQKVELIEGEILVHHPLSPPNAAACCGVHDALRGLVDAGYRVRCRLPFDLGQTKEPEPDVAVVIGTRGQYMHAHPTTAVLIVEVADSSLAYDRGRKGSLYAAAAIRDYWIVNLVDNQVEVYRDPVLDPQGPHGWRYSNHIDLRGGDSVSPLALPQTAIPVADLLP